MIKKLIQQMLTAQIFSALTVSLCLLIDSIMIGRFLGEQAIAAYGLANPVLLIIGAIGTLLSAGIQVACGKSLGKGSQEGTNAGYSSAIAITLAVSLSFMLVVLLFRGPVATVMGAGTEGELFDQTKSYLTGFILGAPASMGALILVPFLQLAGQSTLLITAVLTMTVADVVLDLLNVFVFHGGMFGMGLASSLSYYFALIVAAFYFLSKKCVFRFSLKLVTKEKVAELFKSGIPAGFNMLSSVVFVYVMNQILNGRGGAVAVAAFSVVSTIGNSANCITTGIGGVSLTLSGIFFNEEDKTSLKELIRHLCRYSLILGAGVGVVLIIFAPYAVRLFIPEAGEVQRLAIFGVRLFSLGLIPCCINNAIKYSYEATERAWLMVAICIAEGAVFPILAALVFSWIFGIPGAFLYFVMGELLTLLAIGLWVYKQTGKKPWEEGAYLLLKEDFGVSDEDLLEVEIRNLDDVSLAAEEAAAFCQARGQSTKVSNHIALCVEEMARNTIQHGFGGDEKGHHLSVRVLNKPDYLVLRFRDDCKGFDPVNYVPKEGEGGLGIRLVTAITQEAKYTYSLNMNNLSLKLSKDLGEANG